MTTALVLTGGGAQAVWDGVRQRDVLGPFVAEVPRLLVPTRLRAAHLTASAAIPILFEASRVDEPAEDRD